MVKAIQRESLKTCLACNEVLLLYLNKGFGKMEGRREGKTGKIAGSIYSCLNASIGLLHSPSSSTTHSAFSIKTFSMDHLHETSISTFRHVNQLRKTHHMERRHPCLHPGPRASSSLTASQLAARFFAKLRVLCVELPSPPTLLRSLRPLCVPARNSLARKPTRASTPRSAAAARPASPDTTQKTAPPARRTRTPTISPAR